MSLVIYHVNAFTQSPFSGNPAAVCVLEEPMPDHWLQAVSAQMNLSETAFVLPLVSGYSLRWFTPCREVELCGHATLASAHVLRESGLIDEQSTLQFHTLSGILEARFEFEKVILNFPASPALACAAPQALIDALGVEPIYCAKFGEKYLLQLSDAAQVREAKPNFSALNALSERGVTITSADDSGHYDFISRYFAPWVGIDEDPVNGSSHCALAPFWANKLAKQQLRAYQASLRSGILELENNGDRIAISGYATTVLKGELCS